MSTKNGINPDDIKISPEDSIGEMAAKAGLKLGLRHAQASEAKAAEKAKQPREPSGFDVVGTEDYDPKKHGPLPKTR